MYRGWQSTKLHLSLIAMGLVTVVYGWAGFPKDQFATYCTTLIAAAGIFSGAAVLQAKGEKAPEKPAPKLPPERG